MSVLLDKKKFRSYDHKDGTLRGFRKLEYELGSLEEKQGRTNSKVRTWSISQNLNNSVHNTCRHITSSVRGDFQRGMMRGRRLR